MAITQLIVAVRTTGANQLRQLSAGFRQAGTAGSRAANQIRRDFDQAVIALQRARDAEARARRSGNARDMHLTALAARQAAQHVDNLADQLRQANRAAGSLAGRMGAVAAAAFTAGSGMPAQSKLMVGGLVAAVAAAAPALGAALQGAMLAGLAGVGLGAAIFAALKDADIKAAFTSLFSDIGKDLKTFGRQLGPDLVASADAFRQAWARARDFVRSLFADLSTAIGPLTSGLIGMAREAGPGIKQAFAAAVPVLIELGRMLPTLGRGIGSFFESISESGTGAMKGLRFLVLSLSGSLMILGKTIQGLSAWFDFWTQKAETVYSALAKIPLLGRAFQPLADMFEGINKPAENTTGQLKILNGTQLATAQAARQAADAVRKLSEELGNMVNDALSASEANIAWEESLDALAESVKEHGRQIDISTEAGRANARSVNTSIELALRKRDSAIAMAGGEKASADAVNAANAAFRAQIAQLEATLLKMGFTKAQVDALLGSYRALAAAPNITKNIDFNYRTRGTPAREFQVPGAGIPSGNLRFAASGGSFKRGESAVVGENGWEFVTFGKDAQVHSHADSKRMLARANAGGGFGGTASGGGVTVNVNVPAVANPAAVGAAVVEAIKAYERNAGTRWRAA